MAKRSNSNKPGSDSEAAPPVQQEAASASAAAPEQSGKNPAAVELGRLGGKKGGPARAKKLTKQQRSAIARKAAQTRWAKRQQ
jgi:hypothetical protein